MTIPRSIRPWHSLAGLTRADAPEMFREAAQFYATLPHEVNFLGRGGYDDASLRGFAESRREYLHRLLDVVLDLVETVDASTEGRWP